MPGIKRQGKGTRKNKKGRRKMWREELWKGPPEQQDWSRAGGAGMRPRITYASEAPTRRAAQGWNITPQLLGKPSGVGSNDTDQA